MVFNCLTDPIAQNFTDPHLLGAAGYDDQSPTARVRCRGGITDEIAVALAWGIDDRKAGGIGIGVAEIAERPSPAGSGTSNSASPRTVPDGEEAARRYVVAWTPTVQPLRSRT